jgi:hypothetical protein
MQNKNQYWQNLKVKKLLYNNEKTFHQQCKSSLSFFCNELANQNSKVINHQCQWWKWKTLKIKIQTPDITYFSKVSGQKQNNAKNLEYT